MIESKYLNSLHIDFTSEADQAAFTFTYAPEKNGSLYFTKIQSKITLEGCSKDAPAEAKFNVVWQEELDGTRARLKDFSPDITEYEFTGGKKYLLSYALLDLKGELKSCSGATVKFAVFTKNYGASPE